MNKIPVFLASDDNYSPFCATTMASILMHTKEFIEFYILDCGISQKNKIKIEKIKNKFKNCSIEFLNIDIEKHFKNLPELQFISKAMYARYLIPILKPEINSAIYSDIDVAFVSDINTLWNEDLSGFALGAVPSQRGKLNNNYSEIKKKLNLSIEHDFFMTGLLLIDCKKWRNEKISEKLFRKTIELKNKIDLPDQEVFNVIFDNNYRKLDSKYCVIYKIFNECYDREKIDYLLKNQIIVHYPGALESKPWNNKDLKSAQYFWRVVNKTDFKKEIKRINKNFNKMKKKHLKNILEKIFSVRNSDDKRHKIITILGIKIKNKRKKPPKDYDTEILELNNKIKSLRVLLDSCIDITKIPPAKGSLRKLQIADTIALEIFHKICKKNNLSYWLDYGTLLGAIRHKGFVPWDDDIDLGMMRDDYEKIRNELKGTFEKFGFVINEGIGYYRQILRLRYKDSIIQIDLWPHDYYYKQITNDKEELDLINDITVSHEKFYSLCPLEALQKGKVKFSYDELLKLQNEIIMKYNQKDTQNGAIYSGSEAICYDKPKIYNKDIVFPLKDIEFEGIKLCIPSNYDFYLKRIYKDYLALPKDCSSTHPSIIERIQECNIDNLIDELKELNNKI